MNSSLTESNFTDHGLRTPRSGRRSDKASQVVSQRNPCENQNHSSKFNIGTWNVRTMKDKLEELVIQMKKTDLDILGICETRWEGNGDYIKDDLRIIHSGNPKGGTNGVAIVLRGRWKENVLNTYH